MVGKKRAHYAWRFAVDFAGGPLAALDWRQAKVEPRISLTSGRAEIVSARPLAALKGARVMFDVVPAETLDPITIRLYLKAGERSLSETWLYEWVPPALDARLLSPGRTRPDGRAGPRTTKAPPRGGAFSCPRRGLPRRAGG